MATPHVAGVAGLLKSTTIHRAESIEDLIVGSAENVDLARNLSQTPDEIIGQTPNQVITLESLSNLEGVSYQVD